MTRTTALTLLLLPLALTGCNGAFVGNILVLGMAVGIFVGTLSLGRSADTSSSAAQSTNGGKNS